MAKGGAKQPQGSGRGIAGSTPSSGAYPGGNKGTGAAPTPPVAWGGPGAPGQTPEVIPGQGKVVKGDPGTATVTGFRTPPPVAAPAAGGGDSFLRSQLAQLMMRQRMGGGGNAGYGGGDRGFWRSPGGQETMAMYGAPPYPVR